MLLPCCNLSWKTYRGFKSHFLRNHKSISNAIQFENQTINFNCTEYNKLFFSDKSLIGHLKTHLRSGVSIICPFNSCTKSFAKVQSFSCHLTKHHKQKATSKEIIHIVTNIPYRIVQQILSIKMMKIKTAYLLTNAFDSN